MGYFHYKLGSLKKNCIQTFLFLKKCFLNKQLSKTFSLQENFLIKQLLHTYIDIKHFLRTSLRSTSIFKKKQQTVHVFIFPYFKSAPEDSFGFSGNVLKEEQSYGLLFSTAVTGCLKWFFKKITLQDSISLPD